jgi:NADH dehydrogenase
LYESGRQTFQGLHIGGARAIAERAARGGIARFAHISALGADPASPSAYARSKAAGEAAVREAIPGAAILRPSVVFGPEDHFFNRFAQMASLSPALPLIGGGKTRFQPVYVTDVGQAVARAVWDPGAAGRTFELGGPEVFTFEALMRILLAVIQRRRLLVPVPWPVAGLLGRAGDLAAAAGLPPPITRDQVLLLKADNVANPGSPGLAELGVTPSPLQPIIPSYLYRYRRGGQYAASSEALGGAPT